MKTDIEHAAARISAFLDARALSCAYAAAPISTHGTESLTDSDLQILVSRHSEYGSAEMQALIRAKFSTKSEPVTLSDINELARKHADSYASPHHFTMNVKSLRELICDIQKGMKNG